MFAFNPYFRKINYLQWSEGSPHIEAAKRAEKQIKPGMRSEDVSTKCGEADEVSPWFSETDGKRKVNGIVYSYFYWIRDNYEFGDYPDKAKVEVLIDSRGIVRDVRARTTRFSASKKQRAEECSQVSPGIGDEVRLGKLLQEKTKIRPGMKSKELLDAYGLPNKKQAWSGAVKSGGKMLYYVWTYVAVDSRGKEFEARFNINNKGVIVGIHDFYKEYRVHANLSQ